MKRRTVELIMAMALGTLGTMVVLEPSGLPGPGARAPLCEPEAREPARVSGAVEASTPSAPDEALDDVWDGVAALGYVPMDTTRRVTARPGEPAEVELTLTPSPRACSELADGRCTAGCFEVMAAAGFDGIVNVEVSPLEDEGDVIAASLEPGRVATAGHCRGFALGRAGVSRVRARVSVSGGEGPVEIAAWRHRDPEGVPPSAFTLRLPRLGTTRAEVFAREPDCESDWYDQERTCRVHGSVGSLPLSETCQDGCTWWTYHFDEDDRLDRVELRRSVADVDDTFVGKFYDEAVWIADALDRGLGSSGAPELLETWSEVDSPTVEHDEPIVLQRRTWARSHATTTWALVGVPGHHAVVELHVTMTAPE